MRKQSDIAFARRWYVPVARDFDRVFLAENRIEKRLFGQTPRIGGHGTREPAFARPTSERNRRDTEFAASS